ncbi:hypothetical protein EMIT040CA3_70001 [Bacillus pseudomycoides]
MYQGLRLFSFERFIEENILVLLSMQSQNCPYFPYKNRIFAS